MKRWLFLFADTSPTKFDVLKPSQGEAEPLQGIHEYPLEIRTSTRAGKVYQYLVDAEKYQYRMDGASKKTQKNYWVCLQNRHSKCPARLQTSGSDFRIVGRRGVHVCMLPWWNTVSVFADHQLESSLPDFQDQYPLEIRTSRRGGRVLVDTEKYQYRMDGAGKLNKKTYWICLKHKEAKCSARLQTTGSDFMIVAKRGIHKCKLPW